MTTSPSCFALVAPPHHGKTHALLALAGRLRAAGVPFAGVVQPPRQGGGYDVESLVTGERRLLASPRLTGLGYDFSASGFEWAALELGRPGPLLLLDEVGLLEAKGLGHLSALKRVLATPALRAAVLAVREEALPALVRQLGPLEPWPLTPHDQLAAHLDTWVALLLEVIS